MAPNTCPYCSVSVEDAWLTSDLAIAIPHPQPLARFHFIIVPARHVPAFYDLDVQEQHAVWEIINKSQLRLAAEMELLGFDIGFQDGATERDHAIVHVVPRVPGAQAQLLSGVEWVFSEKKPA